MESASISGVSVFATVMLSRSSVGKPSIKTERPFSGATRLAPFTATEFKSELNPLIVTYLPSPWSFSTLIPLRRLIASAAVVSGKFPNASESTTLMMLSAALCLSTALIRVAIVPVTTISSTELIAIDDSFPTAASLATAPLFGSNVGVSSR